MYLQLVSHWTVSDWEGLSRSKHSDRKGVAGNVLVPAWQSGFTVWKRAYLDFVSAGQKEE